MEYTRLLRAEKGDIVIKSLQENYTLFYTLRFDLTHEIAVWLTTILYSASGQRQLIRQWR